LTALLLVLALACILAGAFAFTNAVEWAGHRLDLGAGAVGALLAAVSTALPESIIPVVAIVRGDPAGEEVAVGAILGAPFMLATVAMALVGLSAVAFRRRREQGRKLLVHRPTLKRDLLFFLAALGAALALGIGVDHWVRYAAAPLFVLAYGAYVVATLRRSGETQSEEELPDLVVDPANRRPPPGWMIALQFLGGLALIVGGAHLFVEQLIAIAESIGLSPLVLSLLLAPLATELPEKANSLLWIREGKDSLALGNITGAMVFQSTLPVAVGLAFTGWQLSRYALLATSLALAGGAVALWSLHVRRRFTAPAIVLWASFFAVFGVTVIIGP
jgi:cation:H+ antiporter